MATGVRDVFFDLNTWQAMLDRQQEVFSGMLRGARIGIIPKEELDSLEGKILAWEAQDGRMLADYRPFTGFRNADVDLLFVADDEAMVALYEQAGDNAFNRMKELIRRGTILFYVLKTKSELLDMGYEEFLDALGLAFLGACR